MNRVSNTCIVGRGRHTSSKPAKYMKYTHDTWANKMEEGRVTIQPKKRAIHDDIQIWGKTDPTFGGNQTPIPAGEANSRSVLSTLCSQPVAAIHPCASHENFRQGARGERSRAQRLVSTRNVTVLGRGGQKFYVLLRMCDVVRE